MTKQTQTKRAEEARQPVESTQEIAEIAGQWYNKIAADAIGKVEYSPLPWQYAYGSIQDKRNIRIILADRNEPGTHPVERDENLKLIVRSVNHATALAEALREAIIRMDHLLDNASGEHSPTYEKAREALARWDSNE